MKRILINATHSEELRVALVDGQKLYDLDIEVPAREQKKSNVYKGIITRVERSLEAVFVDYGSERHGFLPFKEISGLSIGLDTPNIKDFSLIKEGQELVVQVEKEERGNKGVALTSQISLAGSYLVLMPTSPGAGGISRRIEGDNRTALREVLNTLEIPEDIGLIVRTAGVGKTAEELQWDFNYLTHLWEAISRASEDRKAPYLIFQESNFVIRSIRDYLRSDIEEVMIDSPTSYHLAHDFMQQVMPQYLSRVKLYEDTVPLFTRYQIESQIETAYGREVPLPSGGSIVVDPTEALTSIDINSARATKGADFETTALNINLEAADEIARQLRIRDMGGLFVIDFIDMGPTKNQRMVENRIKDAMKNDRARIQFSKISRFGLLEMSRQRIHSSLTESSLPVCPRCHGQGTIRSVESLSLSVIRILEEEAMKEHTARVIVQLPIDCATFILNEKRSEIELIEKNHNVVLVVVPNKHFETPHFEIERIRAKEIQEDTSASHERVPNEDKRETKPYLREPQVQQKAVVQNVMPSTPQPAVEKKTSDGFLKRIFSKIISDDTENETKKEERKPSTNNLRNQNNRHQKSKQSDNRNRNNRNRNRNQNPNQKQQHPKKQDDKQGQKTSTTELVKGNDDSTEQTTRSARKRRRNRRSPSNNTNKPAVDNTSATQQVASSDPVASTAKPSDKPAPNKKPDVVEKTNATSDKDSKPNETVKSANKDEQPKAMVKAPIKSSEKDTKSSSRHPTRRRRNAEAKPRVVKNTDDAKPTPTTEAKSEAKAASTSVTEAKAAPGSSKLVNKEVDKPREKPNPMNES